MDVTTLDGTNCTRPTVTELRLSAFKSHRGAVLPIGPLTLFAGVSGSGKSSVLQMYEALARLGAGDELETAFPDPSACVPEWAEADGQGRRGFRIGCTVDGPAGPVELDLAVQAEPELRVVGERLTSGGRSLLTTALRDPGRSSVQAAWHTAGAATVTRAPLPDDRLGTALLPLRVAGKTRGQLQVLAAAEQVVVALRSVFACDPQPQRMREPVVAGRGGCGAAATTWLRCCTARGASAPSGMPAWPPRRGWDARATWRIWPSRNSATERYGRSSAGAVRGDRRPWGVSARAS